MNDLSTLNAKGRLLTIDGQSYRLLPLSLADQGDLQTWLNAQHPDPLEYIRGRMEGFSTEQQKFMIRAAIETASRNQVLLGTPEANALLQSSAGFKEIIYLSIRKGDPNFTREKAAELFATMSAADVMTAFSTADIVGSETDPKAPETAESGTI